MTASRAEQSIALARFGFGGKRGAASPEDPHTWLASQIEGYEAFPSALDGLEDSAAGLDAFRQYRMSRQAARASADASDTIPDRMALRQMVARAADARLALASQTNAPFAERLVQFWTNHFAVSIDKAQVAPLAGPFEAEAIRPHMMGNFRDLALCKTKCTT